MATTSRKTVVQVPDAEWTTREELLENPEAANAQIAALLEETNKADIPMVDLPADDLVQLPGGLIKNGKVIKTAIVKELTGEDEEALAKASQSLNPFHFIDRLLRCGVLQIGELPVSQKDILLKELLVGDREQLILGIRRATYGEKIDIDDWRCANCGNKASLSMELDDIPVTYLSNPVEEITFTVPLRKGGVAHVKLANGEDQAALFDKSDLTKAQQETVLLSRCVHKIVTSEGIEQNVAAFPSTVLKMSVPDRHAILDALRDRQPGPKYDEIKYTCESCGEEGMVAVGIGHLFLDFGWL